MSTLFSTVPGLSAMLIAVIVIETVSLLGMWLIILIFRRARTRQRDFFLQLYGIEPGTVFQKYPEPVQRLVSHIDFPFLLWTYILVSVGLVIVTLLLFIFQPHWL